MERTHRRSVLGKCPVCGEGLEVTRLQCSYCETGVDGRFQPCKFCLLNRDQKDFIEIFIRSRGNIKEVERELGISYPTVRGRLDAVIEALGYKVDRSELEDRNRRRKEILDALNRGEMNPEQAIKELRQG
ncbi:MAG: DUF2089 domain-containing protein [bacterium]|nr:DUF2089 domain-containing protein [bacterium]